MFYKESKNIFHIECVSEIRYILKCLHEIFEKVDIYDKISSFMVKQLQILNYFKVYYF